jgi:predicted RNA-binding protein Jag
MNSFERRQAHMVVADNPNLITESIGEDPHRAIVIKKRD